jgi:ketosteroid isomerase-like protein
VSQENVELVRGLQPSADTDLVAAFRDDATAAAVMETLSPFFHDDVEIVWPPTFVAGEGVRFVGLEELRAGWLDWLEPWESYRVEVEDVIDAGEDAVVLVRDFGRRAGMTAEVSVVGGAVWTVRDGRVARVAFYLNRGEALKAVGLEE